MKPLVAAIGVCTISSASLAIVVANSSQYIDRPTNAIVGKLKNGTCVPIGERFALTADHVGVKAGWTVEIDGQTYTISRVIHHPNAPSIDLKVIEIAGPPYFTSWMPVNPDPSSVPTGVPIYIGGYGVTSGEVDGTCVQWSDRAERWAMNNLEGHVGHWSWYRFDMELANEGIAAVYDSGSPLLVADDSNCTLSVVGVASSATSGSTGPSCDGHTAYYTEVDPLWLAQYEGPMCEGDLDADGDTDISDFATLAMNFGSAAADAPCVTYRNGDLNENGILDLDDVNIMIVNFGCTH
jgi:hypothetical protein